MAFEGRHYVELSEAMAGPHSECAEDWDGLEEARVRASVSRAYYGAFLHLKAKLKAARHWTKFPEKGIHKLVIQAVESTLQPGDPIVQSMRSLKREREDADYDQGSSVRADAALVHVDAAFDLIEEIDQLPQGTIRAIANELYDISQTPRRR